MSLISNSSQLQSPPKAQSPFAPLLLWIALQLIALCLSAGQVPFAPSKAMPQPVEVTAAAVMLVVQMGASALLFPYLMRTWSSALLVIASSWPMIGLAECLGGQSTYQIMWSTTIYVTLWLAGLSFWGAALRSARAKGIGIAIASLITFGGAMLAYLRYEYGAGTPVAEKICSWSPILGGFTIVLRDYHVLSAWLAVGGHALAGLLAWICSKIGRSI